MKIMPRGTESDESKQLVERMASTTALGSYAPVEQMLSLPVHVHEADTLPNLDPIAVHLFPDGLHCSDSSVGDYDAGPDKFVMIGGNLECHDLFTTGFFGVSGHIDARAMVGESGSNRLLVAKSARVTFLHERGHSFEFGEALHAEILCSDWDLVRAQSLSVKLECDELVEVFLPKLIDECGSLRIHEFLQLYDSDETWRKTS